MTPRPGPRRGDCTRQTSNVCSKDQFIPETGDCGGNPIPTIVINRGQIRIGVIEELPEGPFNADGVVAVASIGGDPVDQTGDDVMSVSVEVGDQDLVITVVDGITTIEVESFDET